MNNAVINWREKYKWIKIKREIVVSMYVFLLGVIIVGVNTVLFPFSENSLDYPINNNSGFVFFIEICFIIAYFIILLYKKQIKYSLHITYNSILMIHDLLLKFIKQNIHL